MNSLLNPTRSHLSYGKICSDEGSSILKSETTDSQCTRSYIAQHNGKESDITLGGTLHPVR